MTFKASERIQELCYEDRDRLIAVVSRAMSENIFSVSFDDNFRLKCFSSTEMYKAITVLFIA